MFAILFTMTLYDTHCLHVSIYLSIYLSIQQIREIALDFETRKFNGIRFQSAALEALQQAAESYLTHLFEDG